LRVCLRIKSFKTDAVQRSIKKNKRIQFVPAHKQKNDSPNYTNNNSAFSANSAFFCGAVA